MGKFIAALMCVAAVSSLYAGTLTSAVSGVFSGVAGDPAAAPCAAGVTKNDGSPASVVDCTAFSSINPFNSLTQSWTFSGYSEVDYEQIKASSSSIVVNANMTNGTAQTSGYGRVTDKLISSLAPTDTASFIFDLNGTANGSGFDFSRMVLTFGFNYGGPSPVGVWQSTKAGTFSGHIQTPAYPVQYFLDYDYFFSMSAQNLMLNRTGVSMNASATVDFSHTLMIDSVEIRNSTGDLITNIPVSSQGAGGLVVVGAVPEPSTFALMTGAVFLACLRARIACSKLKVLIGCSRY
jgi:hypothetical protein